MGKKEIQTAICTIIATATGLPVIFGNDSMDSMRPATDYVSVTYKKSEAQGAGPILSYSGSDDLSETSTTPVLMYFSLDFYKGEAYDHARRAKASLTKTNARTQLLEVESSYSNSTQITDFTIPLGSIYENRAQFDIIISTLYVLEDTVESIDTVSITGESILNSFTEIIEIEEPITNNQ